MIEEGNDRDLTAEESELVSSLSDVQLQEIDRALLAATSTQWRKVARVVATAMSSLQGRVVDIPDLYYARRVEALVSNEQLVAQGNIKRMRFCEVRQQ